MEKRKPLYTVGGNINWCSHMEKAEFPQKAINKFPYDPAIPLLDTYPGKTIIKKLHVSYVHCSTIYNSQDMEAT